VLSLATATTSPIPQDLLVTTTIIVIVVAGALMALSSARRRRQEQASLHSGVQTTGFLTHMKVPTHSDRERGDVTTKIKLTYIDPATGSERRITQQLFRGTPNIPNQVSGITDVGEIWRLHKESMAWRAEMRAAGSSEAQILDAVKAKAIEQADFSRHTGDDGFQELNDPIPVTVFVPADADDDLAIVFASKR
jgi:hypothetical protein